MSRKKLFFFALSLMVSTLGAEESGPIELPKTKDGNLYLTINVQTNATSENHQTQLTSVSIPITLQALAMAVSERSKEAGSYIFQNKKKSAMMLLAGVYGSLLSIMTYGRIKIRTHKWANWHARSSLKELLSFPQEQLATELLYDIQHVYQNKSNPTDIVYPLSQFFVVSTKEKAALDFYSSIIDGIRICRVQKFFPFYYSVADEIRQQQERLNHYINLIKSWTDREKMSKLNLIQNNRKRSLIFKKYPNISVQELSSFLKAIRIRRALASFHEFCAQAVDSNKALRLIPVVKKYSSWAHQEYEVIGSINQFFSYDFMKAPEGIHLRYDDDQACHQCLCASSEEHKVIERRLRENQDRKHHFKSVI